MHFLSKAVGFLAVFGAIPVSFAVTARPSVVGNASARMPTMTAVYTGTIANTSTTTSSLLANAECIDAYTACIKGGDACGSNFEECTTKVLFHAKMPLCLSTLAQCSTAGVQSLFGTGSVTALSTVASKNNYGEVTEYTYPTDGSVLGQLITGAAISNKYDTSSCVRRYTSCLKKDTVCGNDFELCTTNSEFKKQMVFCDSTLARCQSEGKIELFGSTNTSLAPSASSRVGEMISEGAALAAINAVSTCYKVVDQCILNACSANPYKCIEGSSQTTVDIVNAINDGTSVDVASTNSTDIIANSAVSAYIKNSCLNTIGSNKYCYATFIGEGQMPTASQLRDEDNQLEIYDEAYASRMNSAMKSKIADLMAKFDTKAKEKCTDTIRACAMRVCGSGSGAACYSAVFGSGDKSINKKTTRNEIKTGCSAIVNTDAYCKYAATNPNDVGTYTYTYINSDAFDTLFPEYDADNNDPIGVVASLNASLATNYSDAAIAQMKRRCQNIATSCVKSMCGADYVNCYRNRTDVYSSLTQTGEETFDRSMNKVGGVLDYTIVLGLCLDTVKNASVCEEHLAIERNKMNMRKSESSASSWGGASNVRQGWIDAGGATAVTGENEIIATDENDNQLCTSKSGLGQAVCDTVDDQGNVYDTPVVIGYDTYVQTQAANSLFKDLIYDLEKEAQAKYNAKMTKQQNMCMAGNSAGGIMGNKDNGSTYMWVKLKSNKVPTNYVTDGLKTNQFVASNELYGSFCRIRVTLQSDDTNIQKKIQSGADWSTAYFAAGDAFTCGSWIPAETLETIGNDVKEAETADMKNSQKRTATWLTTLGAIGGTVGGAYLGAGIQKGTVFGGLTGLKKNETKSDVEKCIEYAEEADNKASSDRTTAASYGRSAATFARKVKAVIPTDFDSTMDLLDRTPWTIDNTSCVKSENNISTDSTCTKTLLVAIDDARSKIRELKANCETALKNSGQKKTTQDKTWIGSTVGAVAVGTAGALMVNKLTRDIQQTNLEKAQKEAYEKWMNEIGKHIRCYIGSDEVGFYGEIIQTSME